MPLLPARNGFAVALFAFVYLLSAVQGTTTTSNSVTYLTWYYNHSSTIDTSINTNINGSGSAFAFACQAATPAYDKALSQYASNRSTAVYKTFTSSYPVTTEFWDVYTTDCQKVVHVHGTTPLSSSVYQNTTVLTNYTSIQGGTYSAPRPTCSIRADDCQLLQSSFSKESAALAAFTSSYTPPFYVVNPPSSPQCTTVCTAKQDCMIRGDHVRLIYWPVTTTGANSCMSNGTTVTATDTEIRTIATLGTTFTSPTVYISFQSLSAWDWGCNAPIGSGIADTIIGLPPQSLSSAVGWHLGRSPVPYNLADLNGFVTSSAYFAMQAYDWGEPRDTIFDELYFPSIWMPNEVLTFRPEWATCGVSVFGITDPPVALSSVADLTSEAPTSTPKPSTAAPAASPVKTDAPKTTATALQDQSPSATPGKDSSSGNPQATPTPVSGSGPVPSAAVSGADAPAASSTTTSNVGDFIASFLGMSKPSSSNSDIGSVSSTGIARAASETHKIVSIATDGVVVGSTTVSVSAFLDGTKDDSMTGYRVTMDQYGSSCVVIWGSTLYVGSALTMGGQTLSAASGGIVVDGTQTMSYISGSSTRTAKATSISYEVQYTTDSSGHTVVVVGSETMSISGSAMVVDGHTMSAGVSGVVIDGNQTIRYASVTSTSASSTTSTQKDPLSISTHTLASLTTMTSSVQTGSASQSWTRSWRLLYIFGIAHIGLSMIA